MKKDTRHPKIQKKKFTPKGVIRFCLRCKRRMHYRAGTWGRRICRSCHRRQMTELKHKAWLRMSPNQRKQKYTYWKEWVEKHLEHRREIARRSYHKRRALILARQTEAPRL